PSRFRRTTRARGGSRSAVPCGSGRAKVRPAARARSTRGIGPDGGLAPPSAGARAFPRQEKLGFGYSAPPKQGQISQRGLVDQAVGRDASLHLSERLSSSPL